MSASTGPDLLDYGQTVKEHALDGWVARENRFEETPMPPPNINQLLDVREIVGCRNGVVNHARKAGHSGVKYLPFLWMGIKVGVEIHAREQFDSGRACAHTF